MIRIGCITCLDAIDIGSDNTEHCNGLNPQCACKYCPPVYGNPMITESRCIHGHMTCVTCKHGFHPVEDKINHPSHYTSHPSGIECITITEHMGFNLGNALKYVWRADLKGDAVEDLKKAAWYIQRELNKREQS